MATGLPPVQQFALDGAVAVALNATVVRLILMPAATTLLGERCCWLPVRRAVSPSSVA